MNPRVLIGGPCKSMEGPLFEAWSKCIHNQINVDVDLLCIPDEGSGGYKQLENKHTWNELAIRRVAKMRQRFLDTFMNGEYDYAMMVDTDVLIGRSVATRLIQETVRMAAQVAYGVFWSDFGNGYQPQVWTVHPYGFREEDKELIRRMHNKETVVVNGGGACTLFTHASADLCRYSPRLGGLPMDGSMWIGEDRTWALCCEVHRLKQIAVCDQDIVHLYKAAHQTPDFINEQMRRIGQA